MRRVTIGTVQGGKVTAQVAGASGGSYEVELEIKDGHVNSACSCVSWNKYGPHCKHVVAMALVYLARLRAAETKPEAVADEAVALPALAKLENWLGLSALPDFEFLYRLSAVPQGAGARHWVMDVRKHFAGFKSRLVALNVHDAVMHFTEGSCDLLMAYHHPSQPLQPGMIEQVLLGGHAVSVDPLGDPDVAVQRIGHQVHRVISASEITHN